MNVTVKKSVLPVVGKTKCCYCGMNSGINDSKMIVIKQNWYMMMKTLYTGHVQLYGLRTHNRH